MSHLQLRLKNCIQTILDLKPDMGERHTVLLNKDLAFLESYLDKVENIALREEDVRALECCTSEFLSELGAGCDWKKSCGLLQ